MAWVGSVEVEGLESVRRLPSYHDEPLHGSWKGHRSIRLNRDYRAIYIIQEDGVVEFALVETVNKHKYEE
jgi:proteic killer suppression protein